MLDGDIEQASRIDMGAIADLLAEGFMDDPAFVWMVPDPADRARCFPGFFRAMVRATLSRGVVLHRVDNLAASLWRSPDSISSGPIELLRNLPALLPIRRVGGVRAKQLGQAVRAHYPDFPFRYLQFVGVTADHRGKGMGSAVLREGLERAEAAGESVYLETSKPENVGFYGHHGFEVIEEWDVVPGGPHFTSMLKRP